MKNLTLSIFMLVFLSACAITPESKTNFIGVSIPDFKNNTIDSLVSLYENDREAFYKAKANNDMQAYYKEKVGKTGSYNVTGFYDDVVKILNAEKDTLELEKFQVYIKESSTKANEFILGLQK